MHIVQTILNVRGDAVLERAIAGEIGSLDEKDLTKDFLEEMSTQYSPTPGPKKTIVENLDEQGS
jgi:hypothetical protein